MTARRVAVLATALLSTLFIGAGADDRSPTLAVDRTGTAAGERIGITGSGWERDATIIFELCGREGREGSADCDVANSTISAADEDGRVRAAVVAGRPPVPCPCVIKATAQNGDDVVVASIAVQGVPTVALSDPVVDDGRVRVTSIRLRGSGPWTSLFGAPAHRTALVTVINDTATPVENPVLDVVLGRGGDPDGNVDAPKIDVLDAGESRVVEVPVELGWFSVGRYTVKASIAGVLGDEPLSSTVATYPWALGILVLLVVQLVLLRVRNRVRRRIHPAEATVELEDPFAAYAVAEPAIDVTTPVEQIELVDERSTIDLTDVDVDGRALATELVDAEAGAVVRALEQLGRDSARRLAAHERAWLERQAIAHRARSLQYVATMRALAHALEHARALTTATEQVMADVLQQLGEQHEDRDASALADSDAAVIAHAVIDEAKGEIAELLERFRHTSATLLGSGTSAAEPDPVEAPG